jgi:hypothetical protein
MSFLPKTMRWLHHLRHSSTTVRDWRITAQDIMKRSWLKFDTGPNVRFGAYFDGRERTY